MGDLLSALPLLRILQKEFPEAVLHVIVDAKYTGMINAFSLDVVTHGIPETSTLMGVFRAAKVSRGIRADLACSVSPSRRNAFAALVSPAQRVVGYLGTSSSLTPFLFSYEVEAFGMSLPKHEVYRGENIGVRARAIALAMGIDDTKHEPATEPLISEVANGAPAINRPYVAIHPYSGWEFRNWPLDRYRDLADAIITRFSLDVIFVYGPGDRKPVDSNAQGESTRDRVRAYCTAETSQMATLINNASVFVGNDSGPLHLAATLGIRHVGLFGPADPHATSPARRRGSYLYKKVECSPCTQLRCMRPQNPCMLEISVDEVLAAIGSLLEEHASPASYG